MTTAATSVPAMTEPYLLEDATPAPRMMASLSTAPLHSQHTCSQPAPVRTSATALEVKCDKGAPGSTLSAQQQTKCDCD